jgi:hypothetical protein
MCGFLLSNTTPSSQLPRVTAAPQAEVAIMCHADVHWTKFQPLESLDLRTAYKEEL